MKLLKWERTSVSTPAWLASRFGDHYCQISVDTTLKLKSSVKDVARVVHGHVLPDIEELTKAFELPPQGVTDSDFVFGYQANEDWVKGSIERDSALQSYVAKYPKEWETVQRLLGIPRQKSRHACAFAISNQPIQDFIPTQTIGGVRTTQYTAPSVESAGCLKMDFLVVNSLNDIQGAIKKIQLRSPAVVPARLTLNGRSVPYFRLVPLPDGGFADIWDLPEDQDVFRDVAKGDTATVFQFNTPGAVQWLRNFDHWKDRKAGRKAIDSVEAMSAFTALDRPGPLDAYVDTPDGRRHNMLVEYARRARGEEAYGSIPIMMELFPETFGVLCYQEQLEKAYRELTECTGAEAVDFRANIAKKKMDKVLKAYPGWMERVTPKLGEETAKSLWDTFVTWGQYGFNKSHAVCYSVIAYACAWLKRRYPLEWWCAVLSNASKNEITGTFWAHCGDQVQLPDINLSRKDFEIVGDRIRAPMSLIKKVGEHVHEALLALAPYTDITDFCVRHDARCVENKTPVMDKATGKQKANKKGELTWKKATSPLRRDVVHRLIVAGVLDSLYPDPDMCLVDKIATFEAALSASRGQKKIEAVPARFHTTNPVMDFQIKKSVLSVYHEPIQPLLMCGYRASAPVYPQSAVDVNAEGREQFILGNSRIPILTSAERHRVNAIHPWPEALRVQIAVPCYVTERRVFHYGPNKSKTACELVLEMDGVPEKFVRWPDRKTGKIPAMYQGDIKGAIGLAIMTRYTENRLLSLDDLVVFHFEETPGATNEQE